MPETLALAAQNLRRVFAKGKFVAVDDVSLSIERGQIHALLGPNGAGKTTTVRMCATLLEPSAGSVYVDGIDALAQPRQARQRLGLVLGGDLGFYGRATASANLRFFADIQGVPHSKQAQAVADALALVALSDSANTKVQEFSRGMKQRLHLARAALTKPALLLLDEPTTGLDPDIALRVRDLIRQFANNGIGVLLTSHSMPEVEELADTITVIGAGRIVTRGSVGDIARFAGVGATTTFTLSAGEADRFHRDVLDASDGVRVVQRPNQGRWSFTIYWPTSAHSSAPVLTDALGDITPPDLMTRPATLEEAYLALAEGLVR